MLLYYNLPFTFQKYIHKIVNDYDTITIPQNTQKENTPVYTGVRHGAAFLVRIIDFHTRTTADEVEIFTELLLVSVKTSQLKVDSGTND